MIYTSYYANHKNFPDNSLRMGISGVVPEGISLRSKELAPSKSIYFEYKETGDWKRYVERYQKERLEGIDLSILKNTDKDDIVILLCYEKPTDFCHRHIVAEYLENTLGITVPELGFENSKRVDYKIQKPSIFNK